MVDLTPFKPGIEAARLVNVGVCHDPRSVFVDMMKAAGYAVPSNPVIGRIDRVDGPEDKRGKKSGWYVYNEIPDQYGEGLVIGVANYGSWKTGESGSWCSKSDNSMSVPERMAYLAARERMREEQETEREKEYINAAARAFEIWSQASDCTDHGYLTRKQITPSSGLKIAKDKRLIIPMAVDKQIVSLQMIADDGQKRFLTGGRTKGAWFKIDGTESTIYLAEGYATGRSINMATGACVYVAFSCHNLYETAVYVRSEHQNSKLIIAGDNGNGALQADQAGDAVFPPGYKDFNDFHVAAGLDAVRNYLNPSVKAYKKPEQKHDGMDRPEGVLGNIYDYYNATSGNQQHGFAIQTALAIGSIVCARSYRTNLDNYTSLYFLNVGKSGTGKEHAKTTIERILHESGVGYLIAGDGYTSAGAVFSALLDRPRHISVIDEFGRYLEAGKDMKGGNHHQREANTKLMESIGRAGSIMRPPSYSSMTLKKDAADAIKNRFVYNPAITLLTMTTPDTLFKTLDMGAIKDGFVNRFIISISSAERAIRQHKPPVAVPQIITDWITHIINRYGKAHISGEQAAPVVLNFSVEANQVQNEFQAYCIEKANYLERFGMAELPGRSNEMAMRISLIYALSKNPDATQIEKQDIEWAVAYIKALLEKTIDALKVSISSSDFEGAKKEILADLRARGDGGITWSAMQKNAPYSRHKPKDLKDIMQALKDADLAIDEPYTNGTKGRPTIKWMATE